MKEELKGYMCVGGKREKNVKGYTCGGGGEGICKLVFVLYGTI